MSRPLREAGDARNCSVDLDRVDETGAVLSRRDRDFVRPAKREQTGLLRGEGFYR
jgi:hypothetical protein